MYFVHMLQFSAIIMVLEFADSRRQALVVEQEYKTIQIWTAVPACMFGLSLERGQSSFFNHIDFMPTFLFSRTS